MKGFFDLFGSSAKGVKSVKCLATTGILIALFIILDFFSIKIGSFAKVNFAFSALSVVGMLYGPVPGILAALAGDLLGCVISGQVPMPLLSLTAMLEGLLYGVMLYKESNTGKLAVKAVIARLIDSFVINFILNTLILMSAGFMSATKEQFGIRIVKIAAEAVIYCPLIAVFIPGIYMIYKRVTGHSANLIQK
ncbi:MAG: folate family ECF transporter S component [Huintestinicola sp.]